MTQLRIRAPMMIFAALALTACSFSREKGGSSGVDLTGVDLAFIDRSGNPVLPKGKVPGFNAVKALIFAPHCGQCHMNGKSRGHVTLDSYGPVKNALSRIYQTVVVDQSMPEAGPLSLQGRAFVQAWFNAGGPDADVTTEPVPSPSATPSAVPAPKPIPSPEPVDPSYFDETGKVVLPLGKVPNYSAVYSLVFYPYCIECHNVNRAKHKVRLDDYVSAKEVLDDVNESVFEEGEMPPEDEPAVPSDRLTVLKAWIDNRGPEK